MKAVERTDAGAEGAASLAARSPAVAARGGLRLRGMAILLVLSAAVFCLLVVYQRDQRTKQAVLDQADSVRAWLQEYLDEHGYLPPRVPPEAGFGKGAKLPYPTVEIVRVFRSQPGPHVLAVGPICGLITPGGDGGAVIVYHDGRVYTRWLSLDEVREEIRKRRALQEGR